MALSEQFLDSLKSANDIVSVMSSYVSTKRAGRDNVCLCPFHSEKTPSCHIYSDTQSFYCFGCGAGGDVITFIRLIENLDYMESVRFLAQRSGIPMPEDSDDKSAGEKTRLLEINREAARFYRDILISEKGAEGWRYLIDRGLEPNTIKRYGLGYAPNDWNSLKNHMLSKGFNEKELVAAALLSRSQKNGATYDKFRYRVMFPIIDRRGNIIGFGGRTLEEGAPAKYLNSDETLVFHKRSNIFSLNFAKNSKEDYLILCEGYMDVIALNQAGFTNAVATLGTAITPDQARLMRQYCSEVVISYDSDEAGQKATMKAINLLSDAGIEARVLQMNGAKDPDEYIKKYGADGFRLLIKNSGSALRFELQKLQRGLNLSTSEGKASYLKKAINLLADVDNSVDRMVYVSDTAKLCSMSSEEIDKAVERRRREKKFYAQKEETKNLIHPKFKRDALNPEETEYPAETRAERGIIAFLIHSPDWLPRVEQRIDAENFATTLNRKFFEIVVRRLKNGQSVDYSALGEELSTEEMGKIAGIISDNKILPYQKERLFEYISVLEKYKSKQNKKSAAQMTDEELLAAYEEKRKNLK